MAYGAQVSDDSSNWEEDDAWMVIGTVREEQEAFQENLNTPLSRRRLKTAGDKDLASEMPGS